MNLDMIATMYLAKLSSNGGGSSSSYPVDDSDNDHRSLLSAHVVLLLWMDPSRLIEDTDDMVGCCDSELMLDTMDFLVCRQNCQ